MYKLLNRLKSTVVHSVPIRNKSTKENLKKLLQKMPVDPKHIKEAQKQRIKIKEKSTKYVPGTVNLQILGAGASGAPASVYLFTDQSRYLFNCGEGTQRLAHEHKAKLARLEHIFTTRTSWNRIGGLPGLCLTVQDAGVPNITLHGPPGLDELFKAMRRFVILRDLTVNAPQYGKGDVFEDSILTLHYIPIKKESSATISSSDDELMSEEDDIDYYAHENRNSNFRAYGSRLSLPTKLERRNETSVMAYICKLKPKPGALSLEKCVEKGVRPGPLLGMLKNGIDVTLEDGTFVKAQDVTAPSDPGPVFIFLDIPSIEYLKDFEDNFANFTHHQSTATQDSDMAAVVLHFTPNSVMESDIYKNFMEMFSPSTKHIVLNDTNSFSGYISSHRIQWQLNQLDSEIFPLLNELPNNGNKEEEKNAENKFSFKLHNATSQTYFHLRPRKGLDKTSEAFVNPTEYLLELENLSEFKENLSVLSEKIKANKQLRTIPREEEYPKIVFLGTGSCIPNKTRNVSAILIHTNPTSSILLDCGEGTTGQIIRFYGKEKAKSVLRNLNAIYISHLHADHHIGLIGILEARRKLLGNEDSQLMLLAPEQISYWLKFYDKRIDKLHKEYTLIKNAELIENSLDNEIVAKMGIKEIKTCLVKHCPHAFGISLNLDTENPFKITYSGDTMPCDDLVELGKDSTILIHEATMEDELVEEAKFKMHSTVSQAIEQGRQMNAKFTLLTHFSQRYAKIPRIENSLDNNLGIAFDNMEVTLSDLPNLHLLYPLLKLMFMEHFEEMEQKAIKRAYKRQRLEYSRDACPNR